MKLSICMMVKDEEKNLERCLNSLQSLMKAVKSELIIVDTGSTDNTVEIAKKYTNKVYFHLWNNNFAYMRNITISYAKGEWVLIIDADEELEDATEIVNFLKSPDNKLYSAGAINIINLINDSENGGINHTTTIRLYKNDENLKFEGSIHEYVNIKGKVINLKTNLIHYGYQKTNIELMEKKFKRNSSLLKAELKKDPQNIRYRFHLCNQYYVQKMYKEALEEAIKLYNLIKEQNIDPMYALFMYSQIVFCYLINNKLEEAKNLCMEALKISDEHIDLYYCLGEIEFLNKNYNAAIEYYNKYLYLHDNYDKLSIRLNSIATFTTLNRFNHVYFKIALSYLRQHKYDDASKYIAKVKLNKYNVVSVFSFHIELFINSKQYSKLKEYFDKIVLNESKENINIFLSILETAKKHLNEEINLELIKEFSQGSSTYSLFNKVRLAYEENNEILIDIIEELIPNIDFNTLIYGDLIYYLIILKKSVANIFSTLSDANIKTYLSYLSEKYKNLYQDIIQYLNVHKSDNSFESTRTNKILQQFLLCSGTLSEEQYESIFEDYFNSGQAYIKEIYGENNITDSLANNVTIEDSFFIYLYLAHKNIQNDVKYIDYLKKALNVFPAMNKGIKTLLNQYKSVQNQKSFINSELEQCKIKVKNTINKLIDNNQIEQAKKLAEEYLNIVKDDEDISLILSGIINNKKYGN